MDRYYKKKYKSSVVNYKNYRKYYSGTRKMGKTKNFLKRLLGQILICIVIVSTIIILKTIDSPITKETSSLIKKVLYTQYDYKNGVDKVLKYTSKIKDFTIKNIPVFEENSSSFEFVKPLDGAIISSYGENYDLLTDRIHFQRGIDIQGINTNIVKSIDDGIVELIGESESLGKFIKINHGENIFSIYSNLKDIFVKEKQKVLKGERLGNIGDINSSFLHFELWINDETVDPQDYIDYSDMSI
ncbi:M23 family metallopeptidase [Caminicella sporogenes]|uniref:M23 family metallopeptidase n=1 Tax=Caminicella sporogenes TaxID=166485 RepID=UPI002540CC54|nr:M23 family metallopeptidase [Caminicella sporogenes]WIF94427.1 M23 family metallopeptidase [Caminicella sporogenes]